MSLSVTGSLGTASTETVYFAEDVIPLGSSGHSAPSNCPTVTARERLKKVDWLTVLSKIYMVAVDGEASDETCEDIIELQRLSIYGVLLRDQALAAIFRMMEWGHVDGLIKALVVLPAAEIASFFNELSITERHHWKELSGLTSYPITYQRSSTFLYRLIEVLSDCRTMLTNAQVQALFTLYRCCQPLALLFPRSLETHPQDWTDSTSLSTTARIDDFVSYVDVEYTDRHYDAEQVAGLSLHWLLKVADIYFAKNADEVIYYIVGRILEGIHMKLATESDPSDNLSEVFHLKSAAATVGEAGTRHPSLERHPASPYLLLGIYLAKHSGLAATAMLQRGLLPLVESLYDEPPLAKHVGRDIAVSGVSRRIMYQLCHAILEEVSRHCDLRDCMIREELREEVVGISRALSMRCFNWWASFEGVV